MNIVEKQIADIIPYENNPRKNDEAVIPVANSIEQFGFKVPIIIDKDNVIVAGHTRLKAAEYLGKKTVPCIVADDLTDEEIKAFRLADNKVAEFANWDFTLLDSELVDIVEIDMDQFGFDVDMFSDGISDDIDGHDDVDLDKGKEKEIECPSCGFRFEV